MTTVAYAMRDHAPKPDGSGGGTISISRTHGGCGESHHVQLDDRGHAYYACDQCAPVAIGTMYGYTAHPGGVPLTPDELADREVAERDAKAAQSVILQAMTDSFIRNLATGQAVIPGPAQKSLAEQVGSMSAAEKAELAALLAGDDAPAKATRARKTA
jgi:hypothetical protein